MKNVQYISASAGSGKTYRLTEELADAIQNGSVLPENVILTTFTVKAADEFKEKAKEKLYERGLLEQAERLNQALIGTVHSIANSLINKYWYLLGMSPCLKVMNDEDVGFYKSQSLANLASKDELEFLKNFAEDFAITYSYKSGKYGINYDFWNEILSKIVEYAEAYEMQDFSASREYSLSLVENIYAGDFSINISDGEITELLNELIFINEQGKQSGESENRKIAGQEMLRKLRSKKRGLSFFNSLASALEKFKIEACQTEQKTAMQLQLEKMWQTESVRKSLKQFITLMFNFAEKWRADYAEYKKRRQVIDYTDMETLLLRLLKEFPEVREDISKTYTCLFVDEFQDSSPIQLKIFDRLSECVQKSIWVGDFKQAIYGFRGTDTELIKAVTDIIAKGNNGNNALPPLDTSWRSVQPVVDVVNKTFVPLFSDILDETQVALKAHRECRQSDKNLLFWNIDGKNEQLRTESLAQRIAAKIVDGVLPNTIAVLARDNDSLDSLAAELKKYDIPILREEGSDGEQKELVLLNALLSLIANSTDTLARAQIAYLSEPGYDAARILDEKITLNCDESKKDTDYLCDIPLIKKLLERKKAYTNLSVKALVQTLVIELNLCAVAKSWNGSTHSEQVFDSIIEAAQKYEEHCLQMSLPATIYGFIAYSQERISTLGDEDGVRLFTFHGSKGLEWETVILLSLDNNPIEEDSLIRKSFYGVRTVRRQKPTEENLYSQILISVLPWTFGTKKKVPVQEIKSRIIENEDYCKIQTTTLAEEKRLMYVAMTRPRDYLIFALNQKNPLLCFETFGVPVCNNFVASEKADLLGSGIMFYKDDSNLSDENWKFKKQNEMVFVPQNKENAKDYEPRDIQPSGAQGGKIEPVVFENLCPRITLGGAADMQVVGTCIHNIFCVIESYADNALAQIAEYIKSCGLENVLSNPNEIISSWNGLVSLLKNEYGDCIKTYHELPFKFLQEGQIVTGSIDFLWETKDGVVLVDYKTFPGTKTQILDEASSHYAGKYKGQFALYEKMLQLAEKNVLARIVYYPVAGLAVRF